MIPCTPRLLKSRPDPWIREMREQPDHPAKVQNFSRHSLALRKMRMPL